ncbi:ABC transporter permease [Halobaculum sp. MBLA0143]|uniref:ABC transporter permease n=1 Tax=Halobaculum sp. MBLA0143 TaxID=3079933 RepID=UPI0035250266
MNGSEYVAFLRVTAEKRVALLRRYFLNSVMQVVTFLLMFALLFFGGQQFAPTVVEDSLGGLIVGFFVWTMAAQAYNRVSKQVETEAKWGTLEQLYMSPFGIERVVFANSLFFITGSLGFGMIVLGLMVAISDTALSIPLGVVPLGLATIFPVIGLGLALGGLSLIYKKIGAITGLMQLFLVGFISLPLDANPVVAALPLTVGTRMLETTMRAGTVTAVSPTMAGLLAAKLVVYVALGFGGLHYLQKVARQRGVLGQY